MREARYDDVADFYEMGWSDSYDDSVSVALLDQLGPLEGQEVLDVACGHGRISRELSRRGADVLGVDISRALITKAESAEREHPLGVRYLHADITSPDTHLTPGSFDLAVCHFGLSDIDDLDLALRFVVHSLRPLGRFVFSILHPCFPGGGQVSGSWPATGSYYDEGWWAADGDLSTLRHRVGANDRTLSTYFHALRSQDLCVDALIEPAPPADWAGASAEAGRHPVFLVANCSRQRSRQT
jgi:SAM-dependent methyltransferase